jgi:hypothetical protein
MPRRPHGGNFSLRRARALEAAPAGEQPHADSLTTVLPEREAPLPLILSVPSVPEEAIVPLCQDTPELATRGDVELGEDLAQVVFHGAGADIQAGTDLGVG